MSNKERLNKLSAFLGSKKGRLFFHVIYSVGASVVIIGALAKILHMPFGNALLFIGMVTEACVFFLSAFDVEQIEYGEETAGNGVAVLGGVAGVISGESGTGTLSGVASQSGGGTAIIGGGGFVGGGMSSGVGGGVSGGTAAATAGSGTGFVGGSIAYNPKSFSPEYVEQMDHAAKGLEDFGNTMTALNDVSKSLLTAYKQMTEGTSGLSESSTGFSDSVKMLNENITDINAVCDAQMQSIKDQLNTIKYINGSLERIKSLYDNTVMDSDVFRVENERMTRQIQELNRVYARLLQAMNAGGGYGGQGGYSQGGGYNPPL